MLKKISLFSIYCAIALLFGCGQSGPLYLPKETAATNSKTTTTATHTTNESQQEPIDENPIY